MSVLNSSLLLGAPAGGGGGGYAIGRSLRFNSADSAYLSRTPSSNGNRKTFTFSAWVKLCNTNNTQNFLNAGDNSTRGRSIFRYSSQKFGLLASAVGGTTAADVTTDAVFQDFAAWYHMTWAIDTTEATGTNRVKLWVNGASQQLTFTTTPDLDGLFTINHASAHRIGGAVYTSGQFPDFYLADIHLIDGQALDHTSFGEFDANGIWQPIEYTGSYGTNGFKLDFADNASTTTIGYDAAGSNDWTANNLSVTAGAGNDSLVDSPTSYGTDTGVGGEVRGNYCTWNPLINGDTAANGNLDVTNDTARGTHKLLDYDAYWEITSTGGTTTAGTVSDGGTTNTTTIASGKTYGFKLSTAGALEYKNITDAGNWTSITTGLTGTLFPYASTGSGVTGSLNTGQRAFAATAPSGFKALNTANLPAPTIVKPSTVMDVVTYTGTGATLTPTSTLGFSPDLVWIKGRSGATDNTLYDVVRGVEKRLESNTTDDEVASDGGLTAFNSNGFTLGTLAQVNTNTATYAAWCWDESVSAGFDIVTYTGNGSARTISHSLGVAPGMIIVKSRTTAGTDQSWAVYHSANTTAPETDYLLLDTTAATADLDTVWNDTAPTSSVFSVGTNALVNTNNDTYVAYCFAPVSGYSAFGSYTGNGSADGPFVYTGFRPRWIMVKRSDSTGNWTIKDTSRPGYNVTNLNLFSNLSGAETTEYPVDLLSNGFKVREGTFSDWNANSGTYIYAAFAENPFALARAR